MYFEITPPNLQIGYHPQIINIIKAMVNDPKAMKSLGENSMICFYFIIV